MSFAYRELSFNDDVQVNVETEAHFPYEAFVESQDARHSGGGRLDPCGNARIRCNVCKFEHRRPQLVPCVISCVI